MIKPRRESLLHHLGRFGKGPGLLETETGTGPIVRIGPISSDASVAFRHFFSALPVGLTNLPFSALASMFSATMPRYRTADCTAVSAAPPALPPASAGGSPPFFRARAPYSPSADPDSARSHTAHTPSQSPWRRSRRSASASSRNRCRAPASPTL